MHPAQRLDANLPPFDTAPIAPLLVLCKDVGAHKAHISGHVEAGKEWVTRVKPVWPLHGDVLEDAEEAKGRGVGGVKCLDSALEPADEQGKREVGVLSDGQKSVRERVHVLLGRDQEAPDASFHKRSKARVVRLDQRGRRSSRRGGGRRRRQ